MNTTITKWARLPRSWRWERQVNGKAIAAIFRTGDVVDTRWSWIGVQGESGTENEFQGALAAADATLLRAGYEVIAPTPDELTSLQARQGNRT